MNYRSAKEIYVSKHDEVLEITTVRNAKGDIYEFTLWVDSSGTPRYTVAISSLASDDVDCGFEVDPSSLQKLTAWCAKAVVRVNKSVAVKSTVIRNEGNVIVLELWAYSSETSRYGLQISVLPDGEFSLSIDSPGLQELTAWFAKALVRVSRYEADHPHS